MIDGVGRQRGGQCEGFRGQRVHMLHRGVERAVKERVPEIKGVDTVDKQIAVTRDKARIAPSAPIKIRRFAVVKVVEP